MTSPSVARYLLRAKDLIDARYAEPLDVAGSPGHEFRVVRPGPGG